MIGEQTRQIEQPSQPRDDADDVEGLEPRIDAGQPFDHDGFASEQGHLVRSVGHIRAFSADMSGRFAVTAAPTRSASPAMKRAWVATAGTRI